MKIHPENYCWKSLQQFWCIPMKMAPLRWEKFHKCVIQSMWIFRYIHLHVNCFELNLTPYSWLLTCANSIIPNWDYSFPPFFLWILFEILKLNNYCSLAFFSCLKHPTNSDILIHSCGLFFWWVFTKQSNSFPYFVYGWCII